MKKTTIGLSCLLLLCGAVRASAQDPGQTEADEGPAFVGDYIADDAAYDRDGVVDGTYVGDSEDGNDPGSYFPEFGSPLPPMEYDDSPMPADYAATGHGSRWEQDYCDDGYGSIGSAVDGCNRKWLRAETLLWFPQVRNSPALVTANDGAGPLTTRFGDGIDSGLAPGYRFDYGHYFGGGNVGVGARVWGLYDASEDFSASSDGSFNLQRPFFNTSLGISDALIIANTGGAPRFDGSVDAESELRMVATEAYGRLMFGQAPNFHVDLIGGYSYFGIDDLLDIRSLTRRLTAPGPVGEVTTFRDSFDTENRFHGGQVGFETMLRKGRWSMFSLTKVHLGNMTQRVRVNGSSTRTVPAVAPENFENGFLVQGQQGNYEQDEFTFVPEVNVKLAYLLRRNVSLSVGYSFLYWNNVALAGDQIDTNLDPTLLLTNDANPELADFDIRDSGFWIQGIDLGVTIDF